MKRRNKIVAAALACTLLLLSGCNTFHGFGRDIEALGNSIQNTGRR